MARIFAPEGRAWLLALSSAMGLPFGCERYTTEPWEKVPLAAGQIETTALPAQDGMAIERVRFFSKEMNAPRFFLALIPKSGAPPRDVLILNHGWFDRPEMLLRELKVSRVCANLLTAGDVRPALIILPDVRFDNFFREHSDRYPFPNYLTLVGEEVASAVSKKYAVPFSRDGWSMGGFSFGGMVSLDVGRRYSRRFGSISVVSGIWDDDWTYWPAEQPPPGGLDVTGRGKQTMVEPGPAPRIFLACGTDDRFFSRMLTLHEKFQKLGVSHEWSTAKGGHTWEYWGRVLPVMLKFHLGRKNS